SAGGGTDVLGRLLASWLTEETGTTFIVDNVPGGGGAIGVQKVVQSPADGSVLLLATPGPLVVQPLERNDLPYQIDKDLEVLSLTWVQPFALITRQDRYSTVEEFIAAAKARPGEITYGSSGVNTLNHAAGEVFANEAGVDLLHIP